MKKHRKIINLNIINDNQIKNKKKPKNKKQTRRTNRSANMSATSI